VNALTNHVVTGSVHVLASANKPLDLDIAHGVSYVLLKYEYIFKICVL